MENISKEIDRILLDYNVTPNKYSEYMISESLSKISNDTDVIHMPKKAIYDICAFEFCEDYQSKDSGWDIFFGPKFTFKNDEGEISYFPSLTQITPETIEHWTERALQFSHPILKVRYSLLIWEFTKLITGKPAEIIHARNAIDYIIEIAKKNCYHTEIEMYKKLEYALTLALQLNDIERAKMVSDVIIEFEDNAAQDELPGLWGYAFKLLSQKKLSLPNNIKSKILTDMEERLSRLVASPIKDRNPWAVENASLTLANYYRKTGQREEVLRVLKCIQRVFDDMCESVAPLQASSMKQKLHNYFIEYGYREEAEKVNKELRELGMKTVANMQALSQTFEISDEKMQNFLKQFTEADYEISYIRIIVHFIPKISEIEKQLDEMAKVAPLTFMIRKQILDNFGRPVAVIGSLCDDRDGNIISQMAQNMQISSVFMKPAFDTFIKQFSVTSEKLLKTMFKSPLFTENKRPFIEFGVNKYFDEDYVTCIHILVPQIEDLIRILVELSGGTVLKASKYSESFNLKLIDDLLRDELFIATFDINIALYFRVLLSDPRGWNVRNNMCHGLANINTLNRNIADRLIHVLMILSLVEGVR